ncbi:MAG: NUDIX domain-containing protein [Deltaproteobacteria bacterium]|nr:MAG: NUDIX domain-containing protein [Deltaproteobacteria bacterium]
MRRISDPTSPFAMPERPRRGSGPSRSSCSFCMAPPGGTRPSNTELSVQSRSVRLKAMVWILRPGASGPSVLLLERPPHRGGGEHPVTGKAEPGETAAECAAREVLEETGLGGEVVDLQFAHQYQRKKGPFEEHAFLLRAAAGATPSLSDEHIGYRWVSPQEARAAVRWPAQARALDLALQAF